MEVCLLNESEKYLCEFFCRSDLLEDDLEPLLVQDGRHSVELVLKPFEIVTILLDLGNERN